MNSAIRILIKRFQKNTKTYTNKRNYFVKDALLNPDSIRQYAISMIQKMKKENSVIYIVADF